MKNETYREEGKPYLDGINFLVIPSEESRAAQMLQGDAHIMLWPGQEADDDPGVAGGGGCVRQCPGLNANDLTGAGKKGNNSGIPALTKNTSLSPFLLCDLRGNIAGMRDRPERANLPPLMFV